MKYLTWLLTAIVTFLLLVSFLTTKQPLRDTSVADHRWQQCMDGLTNKQSKRLLRGMPKQDILDFCADWANAPVKDQP